ncbi:type II toxin-antitoxin system HicB family antitoxin [uncultured Thiodictyon sp.]|jgi:predicted RNase H-like HicB family nuclease|uniref:type II toxin-antitoxin system HicB family antitoxin n=1 Tax=uncultured Thiodictyon sp. TaxID=1846217 RepID=UPI0025F5C933|nr:type II toxin-antitoxin system HicB family antitoxin [uncultured Thiodictyon sp.]
MKYTVILHRTEDGISVSVPGLPGCWSEGDTDAEAIENIQDAIQEYLAAVKEMSRGQEVREVDIVGKGVRGNGVSTLYDETR